MPNKSKRPGGEGRWLRLSDLIRETLPHLHAVLCSEDDFIELRLMAKADGTTLAILKRYGSDGGPMICFGSGYGAMASLLAIDATVQGGKWRVDKPWSPSVK